MIPSARTTIRRDLAIAIGIGAAIASAGITAGAFLLGLLNTFIYH